MGFDHFDITVTSPAWLGQSHQRVYYITSDDVILMALSCVECFAISEGNVIGHITIMVLWLSSYNVANIKVLTWDIAAVELFKSYSHLVIFQ